MPPNADGRPAHPVESANKLLPRVAVALAASVQPFKQQPFELESEGLTQPSVVGDGVIVKVALQSTLGLAEKQPRFGLMTLTANPVFDVPELGAERLRRCPALQLDAARAGLATGMGEPEKIERLRLMTILSSKSAEPKPLRLGRFHFQVKLRQPVFQCAEKAFRFFSILKAHHTVIRIPEQVRFSLALDSKAALKPEVEHECR